MNKYEIRTQNKKNAIINAALNQFNEKGFNATSIKDIASFAQVSQVSIYNYFGSKDSLVSECAKLIMQNTLEEARFILKQNVSFHEKLMSALDLCSRQIQISLNQYLSNVALSDPLLVKLLSQSINELKRELFKEYIEEGKEVNEIDESITTDIYLKFIDALSKFDFTLDNIKEEQRAVHQIFLYGILGVNQ